MALNAESKYPSRRSYVLKLRRDASADALAGRVENLVTGRQLEFASGQALIESLARDLQAEQAEPGEPAVRAEPAPPSDAD